MFKETIGPKKHTVIRFDPVKEKYFVCKLSFEEIRHLQSLYQTLTDGKDFCSMISSSLMPNLQKLALMDVATSLLGYRLGIDVDPQGLLEGGKEVPAESVKLALGKDDIILEFSQSKNDKFVGKDCDFSR